MTSYPIDHFVALEQPWDDYPEEQPDEPYHPDPIGPHRFESYEAHTSHGLRKTYACGQLGCGASELSSIHV